MWHDLLIALLAFTLGVCALFCYIWWSLTRAWKRGE